MSVSSDVLSRTKNTQNPKSRGIIFALKHNSPVGRFPEKQSGMVSRKAKNINQKKTGYYTAVTTQIRNNEQLKESNQCNLHR